jgi:hypothetical protein
MPGSGPSEAGYGGEKKRIDLPGAVGRARAAPNRTRLMPGHFVFAFPVTTKEPVLIWHLQRKTGPFKAAETRERPQGYDPNDPEPGKSRNE